MSGASDAMTAPEPDEFRRSGPGFGRVGAVPDVGDPAVDDSEHLDARERAVCSAADRGPHEHGVLVVAREHRGGEVGLPLRQVGVDAVDLLLVAQCSKSCSAIVAKLGRAS